MVAANVFVEIPEELIPPGPVGLSAYQVWLANGHQGTEADFLDWLRNGQVSACIRKIVSANLAPGVNTSSLSYVPTGLSCQIDVLAGETVLIDVRGMCNHTAQQIVHFTLRRGQADLTPANHTGLACARIDIADGCRALDFQHHDQPGAGTHTYELLWRNTNAGNAWLGKRVSDQIMMVPTTMTLKAYT
jgi:hypothetical protein